MSRFILLNDLFDAALAAGCPAGFTSRCASRRCDNSSRSWSQPPP